MPARARSEGKRLLKASVRYVGHAGVGVVSLRGAPISLPTVAAVGSSDFFILEGFSGVTCLLRVVVWFIWWWCTREIEAHCIAPRCSSQ